jgi:outer membrane protein assembly factor BamB
MLARRTSWLAVLLLGWLLTSPAAIGAEPTGRAAELIRAAAVSGGFCVHIGAQDGKLVAELATAPRFLVQGLAPQGTRLEKARAHLLTRGLASKASITVASYRKLPYVDDLVSLLVVDNLGVALSKGLSLKEVVRVLAPNGAACLKGPGLTAKALGDKLTAAGLKNAKAAPAVGGWIRVTKKPQAGVDEWRQWRHDAARSQTSKDMVVDSPKYIRWIDEPRRSRNHKDRPYAVVSAGGRNFIVYDEAARFFHAPARRVLVCRDAYNGLVLWKRKLLPARRSGRKPGFKPATLCTTGDRVYLVLEDLGPLVELDAATGKTLRTYKENPNSVSLLPGDRMILTGGGPIRMFDYRTGKIVWKSELTGYGLVVAGKEIYTQASKRGTPVCLDLASGREKWQAKDARLSGATLRTCRDGVVAFSGGKGGLLQVISAKDGKYLWNHSYSIPGHGGRPSNIFILGGMVFIRDAGKTEKVDGKKKRVRPEAWLGFDAVTGEKKKTYPARLVQKCSIDAATERFLLGGMMDFVDWRTGEYKPDRAVRNVCGFGYFVANGLVYTFPTDCLCFPLIRGSIGLAPRKPKAPAAQVEKANRLQQGPAFGATPQSATRNQEDWPTYRGSPERRGTSRTRVPAALKQAWAVKLDGRLSPPTVAAGMVFVSSAKTHQVHALSAASGKKLWSFTANGPVYAPPSYDSGRAIFGCRDGWVYCLDARSGKLAWRFRAAPAEKRIIAYGQPESVWPVSDSIMAIDGKVYCVAGRHSALDGGIFLYSLDAASGKVLWETKPAYKAFSDLLVRSGKYIYMNRLKIDPGTGATPRTSSSRDMFFYASSSSPFEDSTYAWRTQWTLKGRASGSILVFDRERAFGLTAFPKISKYSWGRPGKGDHKLWMKTGAGKGIKTVWSITTPLRPRAMVLAADKLFVAGPPDAWPPKGGQLRCYATADGKELGKLDMESAPVFDGMAAARGKLYISTLDGKLHCFGKR